MSKNNQPPTNETYDGLQKAYDFFNKKLFNGRLPQCLITLQREKLTLGYFSSQRFVSKISQKKIDEIALNPSYFGIRTIEETLSTLVHEMCHLDQQHNGKPGRGRYHNREWAKWMKDIGLYPSSTGREGGAETGDSMSHYIIKNGPFDNACKELITSDYSIEWVDRFPPVRPSTPPKQPKGGGGDEQDDLFDDEQGDEDDSDFDILGGEGTEDIIDLVFPPLEGKQQTRQKYTCTFCGLNVWGKKGIKIKCGECEESPQLIAQ
ncbi:sprT domain-containing protein [Dickeya dadantii]|nr:SprT-like domain-containing protein [Dickeya dadantii]NPE56594.1 sprT domain-containing protein [Dickeya dadantii]NPE69040.1 sprT domain-containing protein [Dickeya dadantii]